MKGLVGGVLAIVSVLAFSGVGAAMPTPAVTTQDAASTKAFIALQERYAIVIIRSAPAVNAAQRAFAGQIRAGCPGVLTDLPAKLSHRQGPAVASFLSESLFALDINAFVPLRRFVSRIARQQRRLRFSDPALQWQVRVNGAANATFFALRPPKLCTDGRLLESSAFTRITPAGERFVRGALTLDASAAVSPSSLLRRMRAYAPTAAPIALNRLSALRRTLNRAIPIAVRYRAVLRVLGLGHRTTIILGPAGVTS